MQVHEIETQGVVDAWRALLANVSLVCLASRRALWRQTIERFPASDVEFDMEEALRVLAPPKMNDREIVNASKMIRTLARVPRREENYR